MVKYNIIIEKEKDGWYTSEVLELPGCYSQAKTIDQLIKRTKKAILSHTIEKNIKIPISNFIGLQQLEV